MNKGILLFTALLGLVSALFAQVDPTTKPKTDVSTSVDGIQIKEYFYVKNDNEAIRQGPYQGYTMSDILAQEGKYQNNIREGTWKFWYAAAPNALHSEGDFAGGVKNGQWKYYLNAAGALREIAIYANNGTTKSVVLYHTNGVKKGEGQMVSAGGTFVETGSWTLWNTSGVKESAGTYTAGVKTGAWKIWHPDGSLQNEESYDGAGRLNGKKSYYKQGGEFVKNEFYKNGVLEKTEDKYTFQKKMIDSLIDNAKKFEPLFTTIYNGQINQLVVQSQQYTSMTNDNTKFTKGTGIENSLRKICDSYDATLALNDRINKGLDELSSLYKTSYPAIYDVEIGAIINEYTQYTQLDEIEKNQESGEMLAYRIDLVKNQYDTLVSYDKTIADDYKDVETTYAGTYPDIYANEIVAFETRVTDYYKISSLSERLPEGKKMISELEKLQYNAIELKKWDAELQRRQSFLGDAYKKDYPAIYNQLQPLVESAITKYEKLNTADAKLSQVSSLVEFLMRYEDDLSTLNDQKTNIDQKYIEFQTTFIDDKDNKLILKRGERLYTAYIEQYDKQVIATRRLSVGNEILSILDKMIALKGQDNTELNEKLRDAQAPQQMKDAFGF